MTLVAKDRFLVIARYEPQHVIVTTAHSHEEEADTHVHQLRTRSDVVSIERDHVFNFQGRRVSRVWL